MRIIRRGLIGLLLLMAVQLQAQSRAEAEVIAAVEQLRQLMVTPDSSKLASIVSDQLSYGHSSGMVEGKASFIRSLVGGKSDFVRIDLSNQQVQVMDKTAIVRHVLDADTNDNNVPGKVKLAILTVWLKEKGRWQLVARQAVKVAP